MEVTAAALDAAAEANANAILTDKSESGESDRALGEASNPASTLLSSLASAVGASPPSKASTSQALATSGGNSPNAAPLKAAPTPSETFMSDMFSQLTKLSRAVMDDAAKVRTSCCVYIRKIQTESFKTSPNSTHFRPNFDIQFSNFILFSAAG